MIAIEKIIDHTRLNPGDTDIEVNDFLNKSLMCKHKPYNICVYKEFLNNVLSWELKNNIKVNLATVINYPKGNNSINEIVDQLSYSIDNKADELDIVVDFQEYISKGNSSRSVEIIKKAKSICKNKVIKSIIECGELNDLILIKKVTNDVMRAGVNFVKTSTGMHKNSTLEQCDVILKEIKKYYDETNILVGFKISGGVTTMQDAMKHINLAIKYLGKEYIKPETFRIGTSKLLFNI